MVFRSARIRRGGLGLGQVYCYCDENQTQLNGGLCSDIAGNVLGDDCLPIPAISASAAAGQAAPGVPAGKGAGVFQYGGLCLMPGFPWLGRKVLGPGGAPSSTCSSMVTIPDPWGNILTFAVPAVLVFGLIRKMSR